MADVVNLNRFRKRKRREAEATEADRNAVAHGRTRAERDALRAAQALEKARLDGARRGDAPPSTGASDPATPEETPGEDLDPQP